ncbi:hypothetical protein QE152_g37096 [Popillia japonica]|uniref:Uncharacterized protein n=1 Tax=Popillia japonica TaxID=7064 RepID=A0AAW1IBK6_POPJA
MFLIELAGDWCANKRESGGQRADLTGAKHRSTHRRFELIEGCYVNSKNLLLLLARFTTYTLLLSKTDARQRKYETGIQRKTTSDNSKQRNDYHYPEDYPRSCGCLEPAPGEAVLPRTSSKWKAAVDVASECIEIRRVQKTGEQNNCCVAYRRRRNRSLFYQDKDWLRSAEYKQAIV